ncbi:MULTISPECIES: FUSC family protein [unclassified Luteimonas]
MDESTSGGMLRSMVTVRPLARPRLAFAVRSGLCMGVPVLVGWLLGDISAGMMAATGGFTALYGRGRPYRSRAVELGIIALAFALVVGVGNAVSAVPWAVVPTVVLIAMLSTWLGNALRIGPPGAYMFMMAGAAATAMPADHINPAEAFVLVLSGGAFAWLAHMSGALLRPRGPEERAVKAAARSVAGYMEAVGSGREGGARQVAAQALSDAWNALVSFQPAHAGADTSLAGLRQRTRALNSLFSSAMEAAAEDRPLPDDAPVQARQLGELEREPPAELVAKRARAPLGHMDARALLRESLRLRSMSMLVVARVGVAAVAAGGIGVLLGLDRAYWAVAAAVLMLHQGREWLDMVQRSVERVVGTWIGLLLAGALLWRYPEGLWLVAMIMVLQFTVEMMILRNYALAAIFITAAALTLATGGVPVPDLGSFLLARGVDTAVGCAVALVVFQLTWPRASAALIPEQLRRSFTAIETVAAQLANGAVAGDAARDARRELQHRCFVLLEAYRQGATASRQPRREVERLWPAIAATEELAFRVLTSCWAVERLDEEAGREAARSMFGQGGLQALRDALGQAALAVDGNKPSDVRVPDVPGFLEEEVAALHRGLRSDRA